MKIKTAKMDYSDVIKLKKPGPIKPKKPGFFFRSLIRAASCSEISNVNFSHSKVGMKRLKKGEPCLYLMNHSSFIDLKIASYLLYPKPFNIVCTSDGFVGKKWLMRNLGCIPAKKFILDPSLIKNMNYCFERLGDSVLMYPEASYSFDGTATPLPESLGKCLKYFNVPVVMIRTYGAFARDPLYNGLQTRNVNVSAEMKYLLSPEEIEAKSCEQLYDILANEFTFDSFRWQSDNNVRICEKFRADGLNRVLYKCPSCKSEEKMSGEGTRLVCGICGKAYELDPLGAMRAVSGETEFPHIPDWFAWERKCVREEIKNGNYLLEAEVTVYMMVDYKKMYNIGDGFLTHSPAGFHLSAADGRIDYTQKPLSSYSLYSDYNWYEIGDMICIGNSSALYYCFPKGQRDIAAKARLATEELYKLKRARTKPISVK